jgi:hypothetical protein
MLFAAQHAIQDYEGQLKKPFFDKEGFWDIFKKLAYTVMISFSLCARNSSIFLM